MPLLAGEIRPAMVEAVRRCRERLVTGVLTNNWSASTTSRRRRAPTGATTSLGLFDVVIESSKVGVRKPDPRFYELACETLRRRARTRRCSSTTSASTSSRPRPWA